MRFSVDLVLRRIVLLAPLASVEIFSVNFLSVRSCCDCFFVFSLAFLGWLDGGVLFVRFVYCFCSDTRVIMAVIKVTKEEVEKECQRHSAKSSVEPHT